MTPYLAELAIEAGTVIGSCRCPMRQADGSVSCSIWIRLSTSVFQLLIVSLWST